MNIVWDECVQDTELKYLLVIYFPILSPNHDKLFRTPHEEWEELQNRAVCLPVLQGRLLELLITD